ncbi:MAG: proline--tRNA ligase [Thermodesulfobacteriota bacterium]|nr:proline--tRNA ligase [Thermodesulfobacteriota bacterium]
MRLSTMFMHTLKEDPREAEIASHRLMIRSGMIKKLSSGIYSYLPYGLKALRKVEEIIREEMDASGAQEVLLPGVQPAEIWKQSGRWGLYGKELLRFKDRKGSEFALGPTHEEVITSIAGSEIGSYKQLPLCLYQIQTKFRDEIRPRFGIMRAREFIMKDAYSFDMTDSAAEKTYEIMYHTYERIFERCGLQFKAVEADTGQIGGSFSHEFMVLAATGEDEILSCSACSYAANREKAQIGKPVPNEAFSTPEGSPEQVHTPGMRTVEEVCGFLDIDASKLIKTMIYSTDKGDVAVLVRGDHEVNEVKLRTLLGCETIELADEPVVEKHTGAPRGFAGPVGLKMRIVADMYLDMNALYVTGANKEDHHLKGVCLSRDTRIDLRGDIRNALNSDPCPRCHKGRLNLIRGIEVGHIFKLGTKYSKAMNAMVLDEKGDLCPMVMGCYGIGVGRVVAAALEQNHDENGIIFPPAIAPYTFLVQPLESKKGEVFDTALKIYEGLVSQGMDCLLDDRDLRPGVKFKDADLIGVPWRITIGKKGLKDGMVEIKERAGGMVEKIPVRDIVAYCCSLL